MWEVNPLFGVWTVSPVGFEVGILLYKSADEVGPQQIVTCAKDKVDEDPTPIFEWIVDKKDLGDLECGQWVIMAPHICQVQAVPWRVLQLDKL